ncbi:Hypothetical protein A7982_06301 [Minicystis rosea]|nr:Hypothetical protein A7982_06301 [Minicystis rosea]
MTADPVMSKEPKIGLDVGDYSLELTPEISTNDALDTEASRERARLADEDAHAAQHDDGEASPATSHTAASADVDASIEAARAAAHGSDVPIFVRDPVTGAIVRQT